MQNLVKSKPSLKVVSPLIYFICWGYVVVNVLFGIGLFSYNPAIRYVIVGGPFTYDFWAFVFLLLGLAGAGVLITNHWKAIRIAQGIGLFIKTLWLFALIFRFAGGASLVGLAWWSFIAYVQLLTVIYFPEG